MKRSMSADPESIRSEMIRYHEHNAGIARNNGAHMARTQKDREYYRGNETAPEAMIDFWRNVTLEG